jgi:hypothetical protein
MATRIYPGRLPVALVAALMLALSSAHADEPKTLLVRQAERSSLVAERVVVAARDEKLEPDIRTPPRSADATATRRSLPVRGQNPARPNPVTIYNVGL